ncbi:MAG: hypothetical protein WD266_00415 [Balneolales bacterium]
MDLLSTDELRELVEIRKPQSLSLFMPTHKTGSGMMQDPIRLKNLLKKAENQLREQGVRHIDDFLEPLQAKLRNPNFWQYMSEGLAVFHSSEITRFYRLPVVFNEFVTLNERFHIKPLMPVFSSNGPFFILALSQGKVRLLRGTRDTITELELREVPLSLEEFLKLDEYEKSQQFHTETGTAVGGGTRPAMFHGHEDVNERKEQIMRWFREIDHVVTPTLNGDPLLLYGVEYLHPLYKRANNYTALLDQGVKGNPDNLKPKEIHEKSWSVMEPWFDREKEKDTVRFHELAGTGKTASSVDDALPAAAHGRVDVLFVPFNSHYWGSYDPELTRVEQAGHQENGAEDLMDLTAAYTVVNSGKVYAVDQEAIPGGGEVAGVFRY